MRYLFDTSLRFALPTSILVLALACALGAACALAPCSQAQAALAADGAVAGSKAGLVSSTAGAPANVQGKANVRPVFSFGWHDGAWHAGTRTTVAALDVTGDAKRDSISAEAEFAGDADGLASSIAVKVNGKLACTVGGGEGQDASSGAGIDNASVSVVALRGGQPFLYVSAYRADGSAFQALYRFENGSFSKLFGNDLLERQGATDAHISKVRPVGDRIVVHFDFCSALTGLTRTSFTYRWKAGRLSLASSTSTALRYATGAKGEYTRLTRVAARPFVVYKTAALAARSFTAKAGKAVRPLAVRLDGARLLCKVACGKKTGWVSCAAALPQAGGSLLRGVYGAVPLQQVALPYSKTKAYSARKLQQLGNHALYIARNEIYARHGRVFETPELSAFFNAKSWYKPKVSGATALGKAEAANVALILSIERNRNSPYVR